MGAARTSQLASVLAERLQPKCLVMCGVCAGNPNDLALGDVVVSELAYQYDEGKLEADGFVGDHRQSPISPDWLRAAYKLTPEGLPSFGRPASSDARFWVLERLHSGVDPRKHPARNRYFEAGEWREALEMLELQGLISLERGALRLTEKGTAEVQRSLLLDVDPPSTLPIDIKVGPIASGKVVVKDGLTWEKLKRLGVRSVLGLEMEAATIGEVARASSVPEWIVIKGVMDHADPKKDDRFKAFAARSSAETLRRFLVGRFNEISETSMSTTQAGAPAGKKVIAGWQPRTLNGPFMEELHAAIYTHAPRYVGMFDLARARAIEAYAIADRAYAVAERVRAILGDKIKSAHSEPFARKKAKTLHVKTENGERELIVKIWSSHDDYIGEGVGDNEDGLGISRVYAVSEEATPELKSSYAGTHQENRYGPLGIYTFPDRAQFAGEWTGGHPSFGYREYILAPDTGSIATFTLARWQQK